MYKAVIFDFDGTLIDTPPEGRYECITKALNDLGSGADAKQIDMFWFGTRRDDVIRDEFKVDPRLFWPKYRFYDSCDFRRKFCKVYDDIDALRKLRLEGYILGAVTGARPEIAELSADIIGRHFFTRIVSANVLNGYPPKPHPKGLEDCLKMLGVFNSQTIYVGNAEEDIIMARNAQVKDVLISRDGYISDGIKPTHTINSLYELEGILR